jgi:hypothetical protein
VDWGVEVIDHVVEDTAGLSIFKLKRHGKMVE